MKIIGVIAGATLAFAASAALAQDNQTAQTTQVNAGQQAQAEDEGQSDRDAYLQEVICQEDRLTGSRIRVRRTCMTRAEWNDLRASERDSVNDMQGNASGGVACVQDQFGGC